MPFYTSGDAELSYEVLGSPIIELRESGPDVVLLHPTPLHHAFWLPAASSLIPQHRVVLPDMRGHGRSQPGDGAITIPQLADDVERLLDLLAVERAFFAGCSIGGYVLFELWRRMPQRISAMAFCCSKPHPDSEQARQKRQRWIADVRANGPQDFFYAMSTSLIGKTARQRDPAMAAAARAMMETVSGETVVAIQNALASRPDSQPTAATIRVPTLVLAGGEDESSTPEEMKQLAGIIRNAGYSSEFHLVEDAGHFAPWEQPELLGAMLSRFFESVGTREV
ncbi:MAG TPA: alpha/beta fold hydrolase [Acidisarcina sp.]